MASISLRGVSKVFAQGQAAVRDLSIEIADGELLVLVGPSGSGKSTVLRLIAGLETPTAGSIVIDGHDVTRVPPQRRDLAMVFQSYALYPHKTVRDNLAFGLRVRAVEAADIENRIRAVAETLEITALLDRKPAQLSGGQRQRVALGRAIVRAPKAFLLDEPLSNLDPVLRVTARAELALLHRRLTATIVYVTHDQEEAMTLGTRLAIMRDGRIEQLDAPLDAFRRPASVFAAGFIGSPAMNLWRCHWSHAGAGMHVTSPSFAIDTERLGTMSPDSDALVVGVRPHDIDLTAPAEGDGRGTVEVVEPLGASTLIHLRTDGGSNQLVRVMSSPDVRIVIGDTVGFRLRRDRLHLFDEGEGRRVN